jgi:hypothetical protein
LFFKDEGRSVMNKGFRTRQGVMRATSKNLTGPYKIEWRHVHKEGQFPVEGSSVFPLIGSDEYILMYDCYAQGFYQFCKSTDLKNFTFVQNTKTEGNFTPRHGSVMHITKAERERLEAWSALNVAIHNLRHRSTPTLTLKQLEQRPALIKEAEAVLSSSTDVKTLNKMTKKLKK